MEFIQSFLQDEFLSKAFILSLITGSLVYLRKVPSYIWQRIRRLVVFTVRIEQTDQLYQYLERWVHDHYFNKYRNVIAGTKDIDSPNERMVTESRDSNKEADNDETIKYRHNQDVVFIRRKGVIIKVDKGRDRLDHAQSFSSLFFDHYSLSAIFFKSRIMKFLNEVVEYNQQFKSKERNDISIYDWSEGYWRFASRIIPKHIDHIIMAPETKQLILNDVNKFITNREWYMHRSIPYKRGYLFYGPPGNGKTSISLALAKHFKRDIYTLSINEMYSDRELKTAFKNMSDNIILLIEDVDALFVERESEHKVSFSALLNCLDGTYYKDGIITILTTNHIEKLDPALIRDGRVDLRVEFKNPDEYQVKQYVQLFYNIHLNGEKYSGDHSMSRIQNLCLKHSNATIKEELFK